MLVIRLQRTGRSGHAMFRVVVQDSRRSPTSGKVVARIGSYDPHTKSLTLDKDKASFYLDHGAQPSDRIARLLKQEGVKLPTWVQLSGDKQRTVRNPDKRRSTRPDEPAPVEAEAPAAEAKAEPAETVTETAESTPAEPAETAAEEQAAEETKPADVAETAKEEPAEAETPEVAEATEPSEAAEKSDEAEATEVPAEPTTDKAEAPAEPAEAETPEAAETEKKSKA